MIKILRFRILTNGLRWTIQRRNKFLFFEWWSYIRHSYGNIWEWDSESDAKEALFDLQRQKEAHDQGWREYHIGDCD